MGLPGAQPALRLSPWCMGAFRRLQGAANEPDAAASHTQDALPCAVNFALT